MIVVYLDWNIFANFRDWKLKGNDAFSRYRILQDLKNSGQIKTYFSDAHILDLMPSCDDSKFLPNDLNAIAQLTDNSYLGYDPIKDKEYKIVVEPLIVYLKEKYRFTMNHSFETIRQSSGDLWPTQVELLSKLRLSIEGQNNDNTRKTDMKSFVDMQFLDHNKALNDKRYFRSRRELQIKKLQTIPVYRRLLSGNTEQKLSVFSQKFHLLLSDLQPEMKNRSDICLAVFMLLDQLNLWSDKAYKNLMIDALHAFYASHIDTDILVTNDDNFRNKAIIAFHVLGIKLPVLSFDEFEKKFKSTK